MKNMNKQELKSVIQVVGVGSLLIGAAITIVSTIAIESTKRQFRKHNKRDLIKGMHDEIKGLSIIRSNYEDKFGIRMFANKDFEEISKD
jgi:hypothetical protein